MIDAEVVKVGLVLFRRTDVKHRNWYCRIKVPGKDAYKTVSLKTAEIAHARDLALEHEADLRFRLKHSIPIFNRAFAEVAKEFVAFQLGRAKSGQITMHRWSVIEAQVRNQLCPYVGTVQITLLGQDRWDNYPAWRHENGKGRTGGRISDGTIRDEMATFRAIMAFAASGKHIPESAVFKGRLPTNKVSREEFTPSEYRQLHTFARSWVEAARSDFSRWYRTMTYNFILIMTNTGMRPSEARNLRWKDITTRTDKQGRRFVVMKVRGKSKHRSLVATPNVGDYLDRIRAIGKASKPDDPVFTNIDGQISKMLYQGMIRALLIASNLLYSSSGSRRSTYCFRHTYATFRLSEGVDSLFLAHQMGTSVQMIQDHYGHVTPVKNADRILQGIPGWVPAAEVPTEAVASMSTRAGSEGQD